MTRFRILLLAVVAIAFYWCGAAFAAGGENRSSTAAELAAIVDHHYNSLKSLRVNFSESYEGLGLRRQESGILLLKKPGRMRWNYAQPAGKVFVLDGHYAYFYTPGDPQAQRIPAKQLDDFRSPLRFLLGHTELQKEMNSLSLRPAENGYTLTGVPKGLEKRVASLSLNVTAEGTISAMRIEEVDGSITSFAFTDEQPNAPAKDADFTFQAPAGVPVVNALPPV